MAGKWYEVYGKDDMFEEFYIEKPHLYQRHKVVFDKEHYDEYLKLANNFHPDDFDKWIAGLGKLYAYERHCYAKVDRIDDVIIISLFFLLSGIHREETRLERLGWVLTTCNGYYQMGGYTDMGKFYSQCQRKLDENSIKVLKSIEKFKYLPIELFKKICVYRLFQASAEQLYQWEILLKMGASGLATDLHLRNDVLSKTLFQKYKKEILGGTRLKKIREMEDEELNLNKKKRIRNREESFSKLRKKTYDLGRYILRSPVTIDELQQEGAELHHCVASYVDRIINGETEVLFLRKKTEPQKPYYTVEVKQGEITQVRTEYNRTDERITKFLTKFAEKGGLGKCTQAAN